MRRSHREILWDAQNGECWLCGEAMQKWGARGRPGPRTATEDHVLPRCMGGDSIIANKRLACRQCNNNRGCEPPNQDQCKRWFEQLELIRDHVCDEFERVERYLLEVGNYGRHGSGRDEVFGEFLSG